MISSNATLIGQDPHRFDEDIEEFAKLSKAKGEDLVVFTGSSSIRFWKNLNKNCNGMQVVNTGFGGSHMSDLLYFLEETVLQFQSTQVYIYEGDNDIAAEKGPKDILETTKQIVDKILKSNSDTKIHIMSAKPSPSRWRHKDQYLALNSLLKDYCDNHHQLFYANERISLRTKPNEISFHSDRVSVEYYEYMRSLE